MAIWIQSLSWTLIYSLGQGIAVYALLWLAFRLAPVTSATARYGLSLSALTILMGWFAVTWWQQFHSLMQANEQLNAHTGNVVAARAQLQEISLPGGIYNVTALQVSLSRFLPWLCVCYAAGFVLMLGRLLASVLQLFSLRNSNTFPPEEAINNLLLAQKKRIGVNRAVRLLLSAKAQAPMVIGLLKPVIMVPVATMAQLDTEQLEAILLHELAHIRRHDYLVNILQTIVETILFFNPFVWMVSAMVRREREYCCDDMVVGHTPEPLSYAIALSVLAEQKPVVLPMAVAASGQATHLYDRIQRIMEIKKQTFSYSRMVASIILLLSLICSIAWVKPTFSKEKRDEAVVANNNTQTATNIPEEDLLVQRLMQDKLINQVQGFVVEKQGNKLFVNGMQQTDDVALKYLSGMKKYGMRMQVFSLDERIKQHPGADLLQLLLPYSFSSPCVDKRPVKEGC